MSKTFHYDKLMVAARPAKLDEERRKKYMSFRANDREIAEIKALAEYYHFDVAEYLRRTALGYLNAERDVVATKKKK
jgi:hypothetical protein